jgi:hypothetical protein
MPLIPRKETLVRYHHIDSQFTVGRERLPDFDEKTVKDEPMFWSATPNFAMINGGPITQAFLTACALELPFGAITDKSCCFDSRVHMLMPGWFPCIPGWHHDDVPRSRPDGQPNYDTPEFKSQHVLALVNGDICPTEFAVGKTGMPDIPLFSERPIYSHWHGIVERDIEEGILKRTPVPSNRLIRFNWQSFHQGTRAVKRGFRWFGRLTWDAGYEQGRPHHNEIRRQTQVYLEYPMEGW